MNFFLKIFPVSTLSSKLLYRGSVVCRTMSWGVLGCSGIESTFYYITLNHSCLVRVSFTCVHARITYVHARFTCVQARMYHDASHCVQNGRTQAATKLQPSCNQAARKVQRCKLDASTLHAQCMRG